MSQETPFEQPSPSEHLGRELDRLYDQFRLHWGDDEENELFWEVAEAFREPIQSQLITTQLLERIQALRDEYGHLERQDDTDAVRSLIEHPIVRTGIELRIAYDALARLRGAESRVEELLLLIRKHRVGEIAEKYLRSAVNLYLFGFETESAVLCGAALEAAYRERFGGSLQARNKKLVKGSRAVDYESVAHEDGIFSDDQRARAEAIRRNRNAIAHERWETDLSPSDAIAGTIELLTALFPA